VISGLEEAESWKTSPDSRCRPGARPVAIFNCGKEQEGAGSKQASKQAQSLCPVPKEETVVDGWLVLFPGQPLPTSHQIRSPQDPTTVPV
jgi:hypothetical protein